MSSCDGSWGGLSQTRGSASTKLQHPKGCSKAAKPSPTLAGVRSTPRNCRGIPDQCIYGCGGGSCREALTITRVGPQAHVSTKNNTRLSSERVLSGWLRVPTPVRCRFTGKVGGRNSQLTLNKQHTNQKNINHLTFGVTCLRDLGLVGVRTRVWGG